MGNVLPLLKLLGHDIDSLLWCAVHHSKLYCIPNSCQQGMDFSAELLALANAWAQFCKLIHSRTAWTRLHKA